MDRTENSTKRKTSIVVKAIIALVMGLLMLRIRKQR